MTDAFAALLDEPRWLAWREEERGGRKTKLPYAACSQGLGSATDPATWGTHAEAETRARQLDDGRKVGCGTVLGDIGDHLFLAGVDLDSSLDDNSALAPWAVRIVSALGSYAEVSPSGRGLKAFFYLADEDVRWFLDRIGVETDKWGTKRGIPGLSGADHGPGIELYCSARYFTVTHRLWSADHPRIVLLERDRLDALDALIPPAAKPGSGPAGDGHDTSRSAAAFRKGAALRRAGKTYEEMVDALRADPETAEWCREKGEPNNRRELRRIWERASPPDDEDARLPEYSDEALALRFAKKHSPFAAYVAPWNRWFLWSAEQWSADDSLRAFDLARAVCRSASAEITDPKKVKLAAAVASAKTVAAAVTLARADRRHAATVGQWDADPLLFLATGE